MKVETLTIHRINVLLSCGCGVLCDFKDPLCKSSFKPEDGRVATGEDIPTAVVGNPPAAKEFTICDKHKKDPGRSMLEFMMAERMDEVDQDIRRPMLRSVRPPGTPVTQQGLEGDSVSKMATVQVGVRKPQHPPGIKTLNRTPEELEAIGATALSNRVKGHKAEPGTGSMDDLDRELAEPPEPTTP